MEGAGAQANNPDLYVASVTVQKQPRIDTSPQTAVIQTLYPTEDIVIADYNVKQFGAAGDGMTDDNQAVQNALDAAGNNGGGVVFVPAGRYKISGNLTVPTGVTLRGDWNNPDTAGAVEGTILQAYAGKGNENETSFIQLQQVSGITNLSIWYPEQSLDQPVPYPAAIEQLPGDSATVKNVTLVNAYNGIRIGPSWNELHYLKNVYGTTLKTGIFLDYTTDIGRLEGIRLSPAYWADSGLPGAPTQAQLFDYMTAHSEGIVMGRSDWEYVSDIGISGYKTGMRVTTRTDSAETANAQFYNVHIDNCNVALKIEGVNGFGLLITKSSFKAGAGEEPIAIQATEGFNSIVQFNTVTVGGNPRNAVMNDGTGILSFENSVFENWNDQTGYAIAANSGSLILGQTSFVKESRHLLVGTRAKTVSSLNSGFNGTLEVQNNSLAAQLNINRDEAYTVKPLPEISRTDAAIRPRPASAGLFNVAAAPYNADKTGASDVSEAVKQALADAGTAGGGTVFFPAGIYRLEQPVLVPSGVELRGSWDVPHHTIGGGSVIFTNYGEGEAQAVPLITLEASAGIRGISVYYDKQDWNAIKPYGWTIQGRGHGVYAIDTTLVNSYRGIDFGTYDTSGHYIDYVAGSPLKEGIYVGGGATGGIVRNVQFNPHYAGRNPYPNAGFPWEYQKENLDAFRIGDVKDQTVFNTFVYGSLYGIHFVEENGSGPEAVMIGHGTDGSKKGAFLEGAGPGGLTFINTELVAMSTTDKVYVTAAKQFQSEAVFHNTSMWGDPTRSMDIFGGKVRFQQSNLFAIGEIGLNAVGGDTTLYNSYFNQAGTTHVHAGPDIERMVIANNIFNGGIKLDNQAPTKVSGTDVAPISLELAKTAFDASNPERTNLTLKLTNLSISPSIQGKIELVQPAEYKNVMVPIRFQGINAGDTLTVSLPYIASDLVKFKVTLDTGYTYTATLNLGLTFASPAKEKTPDAPPVLLNSQDQYFSLGGQWGGADDLSAQASVSWNDENLFFNVDVKDNTHFQNWQNGDIWQGDSIQIGIDLSREDGSSSRNVSEMGFALDNGGTVSTWRWRAPEGVQAGPLNNVQAVVTRDENADTTSYRIAVPIAELHGAGYVFSPDKPIGFTLLLNEHDRSGRSGIMEYNQGIGRSKDATLFGDLVLLQGDYLKILEESAEAAVKSAKKSRTVTSVDAAANFVQLLPDGKTKTRLQDQLDKLQTDR